MNVWVLNHYAVLPSEAGGTRHYDLGKALVRRGHRVTIFASSFQHFRHREEKLDPGETWRIEDVGGVRFVWIRTAPYQRNDWRRVLNMVTFMFRSWLLGRRLPRRVPGFAEPDVVVGSSVHLLAVLAAWGLSKYHRAGFIVEVRDLWPESLVKLGQLRERHPIVMMLRVLAGFLYKRACRIVVLGPQMCGRIAGQGVNAERIVWIPNGVNLELFEGIPNGALPAERFDVVYMGAHGRANALDVLLDAAGILQSEGPLGIRFVLVGDGPEKLSLIAQSRRLGLRNVEFRDPVSKAEVPIVLRDAAVCVSTTEPAFASYGGSLNKLSDYMAAGRPTILSGVAAGNPVEEAGNGRTVPPRDPRALADAVLWIYRLSQEERDTMGRRGRAFVEEHRDISKLAERLERVIEDVTRNRG